MNDRVECYSGGEYAERPTALYWQDQRMKIVEILERSRTPGGKFFRVKTDQAMIFELLYDQLEDAWHITIK